MSQTNHTETRTAREKPEALLLRPKEFAHLAGLSVSFVYTLMTRGELPVVEIGGAKRIPRKALDELLEE